MNVNRIIIHELIKEAKTTSAEHKLSSGLINVDDGIVNMAELLHDSFEQSISSYTKFGKTSTPNSVYININKYVDDDKTDTRFINFGRASVIELKALIEKQIFATGGYYLFIDYEINGQNYISIVIVRNKDAYNIKWDGDNFAIDTTQNVNIDKLAMGFRLNVGIYQNKGSDRNYIALISKQGDDASEYFKKWVNVEGAIDHKLNTRNFVEMIKSIGPPQDYEKPDEFDRHVHSAIIAYKSKNKNNIDIDHISELFYGSRTHIRDHADKEWGLEIDPIFRVNSNELRKLVSYEADAAGISVRLAVEAFQKGEVELANEMVIIRNKTIFSKLVRQRGES